MLVPCDSHIWQGRVDPNDISRFHQHVDTHQIVKPHSNTLIGFCSDEGVIRNHGRIGAAQGPDAIRQALANLTYSSDKPICDLGNILCLEQDLEQAQEHLGQVIGDCLTAESFPIVLGGGHEVAWASFQGIRRTFPVQSIGIINFDAHFDLRPVVPVGSSGTPFRQMADWSETQEVDFNYLVLGINESVNSLVMTNYAKRKNVSWLSDIDCESLEPCLPLIDKLATSVDYLYLSICLDVFPAWAAPGVSAPASLGIDPRLVIKLLKYIKQHYGNKAILLDIAEMNPQYDIDARTAKLAARLIATYVSEA